MGKRINGNPQKAFNQGYTEGKKAGYLEGGAEAIEIARNFTVLALYNIVHEHISSEKSKRHCCWRFVKNRTDCMVKNFMATTTMYCWQWKV